MMSHITGPDHGPRPSRIGPIVLLTAALGFGYLAGIGRYRGEALAQAEEQPLPPLVDLHVEDNSTCMVCHLDFMNETFSVVHETAGVPCAHCHGFSKAHQTDEMAATPPDFLFGRKEIEPLCRSCHTDEHANPDAVEEFRELWRGKQRPNGRSIDERSVCTDCHGEHVTLRQDAAAAAGAG